MSEWETAPAALSLEEANGTEHRASTDVQTNGTPVVDTFNPQAAGWVKPTKFDYEALARDGSSTGGVMTVDLATREDGEQAEGGVRIAAGDAGPTWAANAMRYEWEEEFGDVAPRMEELEAQLFRSEFRNRLGPRMNALEFTVDVESEEKIQPAMEFDDAGLHPVMLENVKLCGYARPTPVQAYCIPAIINGHDLISVAQTGSGKTAAFLIPILSKLMGKAKKLAAPRPNPAKSFNPQVDGVTAEPLVLVIVPTRELAVQIFDEARRLCYRSMLRPCVAYGGGPVRDQQRELSRGCDILIGTPGRLIDFMGRGKTLSLRRVKYTVIDEADEMVSNDWSTELTQLLSGGDNNEDADHRYMMFSATFPKGAQELAKRYLDDSHIRIKVGRAGSTHANIYQHFVFSTNDKKRECLRDLLRNCDPIRTIIFVNAKHAADEVDDFLFNQGFPSTSIHSDRTQREREDALHGFRTGKTPILVTTGVSARGLDVFDVGHVINYDLPKVDHGGVEEYVHRIGRTARIGHVGVATSFYNEEDEGLARRIVALLVENKQQVPDFLQDWVPAEGEEIKFDSDEEGDAATGGADGANGDATSWTEAVAGGDSNGVADAWNPDATNTATTVEATSDSW